MARTLCQKALNNQTKIARIFIASCLLFLASQEQSVPYKARKSYISWLTRAQKHYIKFQLSKIALN